MFGSRVWIFHGILLVSALVSGVADARNIPCSPAEDDVFYVDGVLNDWRGVQAETFESPQGIVSGRKYWNDPKDLSFGLRCNYSETHIYLAISVKDEHFACARRSKGRDHLELTFGGRTLRVLPGDLKKVPGGVFWGTRPAKKIIMAEALRRGGWAVELKIPKKGLPGYRPGAEYIPLKVRAVDVDWRGKIDTVMESGLLKVMVAQVAADLQAFLRAMKASKKDIRSRKQADVVGGKGVEQVVWVRRTVGIVGPDVPGGGGFFYFNLPVAQPRDIAWVRLMDLNRDGKQEIVVRLTQRGRGGSRQIVGVYRFDDANKFGRLFAHEVRKTQGRNSIENRLSFKARAKRKGIEIVIDKPTARGFTQDTYREQAATDVHGILLPWAEVRRRVFRFEGDEYSEH